MELTNAVIIYFALGVPFGILSAYLRTLRLEPIDLFRVVYHLTFWPFIMIVRAFAEDPAAQQLGSSRTSQMGNNNKRVDRNLQTQLAVLDGLKDAHEATIEATELRLPFVESIHHPNPALAAKCFHRRSVKRLQRHLIKAQSAYSRSLDELNSHQESTHSSPSSVEPKQSMRELC